MAKLKVEPPRNNIISQNSNWNPIGNDQVVKRVSLELAPTMEYASIIGYI